MARSLAAVADSVNGRLKGQDAAFGAVCTDTRTLTSGSLFVAIRGERFDGNDYVAAAADSGAVGAIVSRWQDIPLPQIEVDDTREAFGSMAKAWRANFDIPVVAVTGSAGKTTVKELIASILGRGRRVCVTEGNLNNDIGVPLSLMRLAADDEAMVVELGASHAGEIAYLGSLVSPKVAVITNAGAAHLEGFGSVAGVASAKGELIDALQDDGVAVLNADDAFFGEWVRRAGRRRVISFGFGASADVRLVGEPVPEQDRQRIVIRLPQGEQIEVLLGLIGRANVSNALAAAAAAGVVGASSEQIRIGLEAAEPVTGRMDRLNGINGATLIDDSYNANPTAARAALDFLANCQGHRIFVLGDMLELGADAPKLHREIGEYAVGRCDELVAVGDLAAEAADAFGASGSRVAALEDAARILRDKLADDVTVLIKASRSVGLERLVRDLIDSGSEPC